MINKASLNKNIKSILAYVRNSGWTGEYVIINNIINELEETNRDHEIINLVQNYGTVACRDFFYNFKKFATDKKGKFNERALFNAFAAFDSGAAKL